MSAGTAPGARSRDLAVAIRRVQGTVVVVVRGEVDRQGSGVLQQVLSDLIEGQGNLRVLVDLTEARIRDADAASVFEVPAEQARRHRSALSFLGASLVRSPDPERVRAAALVAGPAA